MELRQGKSHYIAVKMVAPGRAPMVTDKEMEGYARDCARLADMTDDPEIREQLMKMAREWMEAALGSKQAQATRQGPRQLAASSGE